MFLGIDCGTQGTKALVLDADSGRVLGEGSAAHRLISAANGKREQQPADWLLAFEQATRAALEQAGVPGSAILAVGVSGQQHGLVLLDEQGEVLRPAKLWCDTESAPQNQRLLDYLGGEAGSLERLGVAIAPGYTVSKLLWTQEQHPDVFARIAHILLPHDYLNYWLSGRYCSEYGDASGTGYFDVRRRRWDSALLEHIDPSGRLVAALPELIESGRCLGPLRPQVAQRLGLNPRALVASGGGDNMMGAIGTGNIRPGAITMSLGTSGTLYAYAEQPQVSQQPQVASFCSSSGGWLPLICTMNLTNATGAIQQLLELDLASFGALVTQAPIGAEGLLMLPFLNGERVPPLPNASASLFGMTSDNLTRANLCRAVVEGTSFGLRYGLDLLRASGIECRSIRLIGGGANSPIWRQIVADIMATPLVCPRHTEAAALGAAIQAAWSLAREQGRSTSLDELCATCVSLDESCATEPDPERSARYEVVYQRYREQVQQLQ
ncbi:xylulose kinase [Pseudomonas taeanensis MS-3]|uniref:Xylulose kinase n=1 Tax=Pseudomonas taeanensis MS-3 TaxID=1395571 RepID=A0A0A1YLN8_9PSED|nr:xylulokinase [Pseudomonas taeanensis]KFX70837.1 xylulose kinase [Pseudomonas taeanensis MS-3]